MLRIERPWRRVLDEAPASDLVFVSEIPTGGVSKDLKESARADVDRDRNQVESVDKRAFNKRLAENLIEDDPLGSDSKEGSPNYSQAFSLELARRRRLAQSFAIIVSKVAEDLSGWPIPGDDEWSIPALMERHITKKPLIQCRQSRERESVVVIVDTSGSCLPQARFYNRLADAAIQVGDVELYAAPNAGLRARRTRHGWEGLTEQAWSFHRRTIIFFGDYDGGDAVVEASWKNRVYWLCSEGSRYPAMEQHPWCSYPMSYFRGKYYDCVDEGDFLRLWRKVR
jgi:hypothetical protein